MEKKVRNGLIGSGAAKPFNNDFYLAVGQEVTVNPGLSLEHNFTKAVVVGFGYNDWTVVIRNENGNEIALTWDNISRLNPDEQLIGGKIWRIGELAKLDSLNAEKEGVDEVLICGFKGATIQAILQEGKRPVGFFMNQLEY